MKKRFRIFLSVIVILSVLLSLALPSLAVTSLAGYEVVDGVSYKLSEDEAHYIAIGSEAQLPNLKIVTQIGGIPVTEIAESAFQNNEYLNEITVPSTVTTIGKAAFRNCKNLVSVNLPNSLEELPVECFFECRMLRDIKLPSKLKVINDDCFNTCTMLGKLSIPASVSEIGHDAFLNCESLLLDVSKNPYAAEYAEAENLNTDFTNTTEFFLLLVGAISAVTIIALLLLSIPAKKYFKKHPKHNPALYIGRFFGYIGKGIGFVLGKIGNFFTFISAKLDALIKNIAKKIKKRKLKDKNTEKDMDDEQSE